MSKSLQNARIERECTHLCRSKAHASQCIAAATKRGVTDQQLASYLVHLCSNFAKKQDEVGRSVLHVAASCGKHELCQWLLTCAFANPNLRDFESGYTSLHRALYYGHVNTAVRLIQFGVSLDVCDNEDMTVLDMLSKERSPLDTLSLSMLCQPYVWGANNNYSLGTGSNNTRKLPDLLEFTKQSISIIQVELEELHSVYVSACGKVWTCGMGQGGRLGTGSGKSALTPQPIKIQEKCIAAAVGINHSLLLLDNHIVLSFGSNLEHQLGVNPYVDSCLSPRQVCNKNFSSSNPITGICASKYHSVFYNDTYVWTCGLNGGQLGRPSNPASPYITLPMKAALSTNGRKITNVASSIGAIVVTVANGDIYILYKFQCKKMATKQLDVVKVGAIGGTLESPSIFEQSSELRVVILNSRGSILLWREGAQHPARCIFGTKQCINVGDFCLTQQHLLLVTKDGSAFQGSFTDNPQQYVPLSEKSGSKSSNQFHKFVDKSECYSVKLKRLANIFRGVSVRADPKGNNFVIIQTHPKTALTDIPVISESEVPLQMAALFNEASEDDPIHDGVFNVSGRIFPVHCYILSINGKLMADQVAKEKTVILKETNPYIFEEILLFLYTGTCQLIQPGLFNSKKIGKKEDPLKLALEICNKYKIQVLSKKLQKLRYEPGKIYLKEGYDSISGEELQFDHLSGSEYYDVTIKAEDGSIVKAHKCMLVARLHYFQSMFLGGWSETGKNSVLPLPFSSNVLKDLIEFIYTDKLPDYLSPDDVDHVIRLLIAGDQFLVKRLKECCELLLINALTLRNAPTVLHLACMYNTPQLKASSIQFISLNLASFLQSRLLEVLDDDILKALTDYYQDYTKKKYRVLTPLPGVPTDEEVEQCPPIPWPEVFSINEKADIPPELKSPPSATKHKKKTPKKSSTSFGDSLEVTEVEVCTSQPEVETAPKTPLLPAKQNFTERSRPVEHENINLWNSSSFPLLDSHPDKQSKPSNLRLPEMSRRVFPPKMSQKERKRLGSESENTVIAVSPPKPVKTWATLPPPPSQNPTSDYSKRDSFSEDTNFINIVAHDKEKRANWAKMKSKPFHLTQLEDKAIDELLLFYNAPNEFDERITVERVITHNIDKPQWIKTNLKV